MAWTYNAGSWYGTVQASVDLWPSDPWAGPFTISCWFKPDDLTPSALGVPFQFTAELGTAKQWGIRHLTDGTVDFACNTSGYTGDNPNTGSALTLPSTALTRGCWIAYRYAGAGAAWDKAIDGVVTNIGTKTFTLVAHSTATAGVRLCLGGWEAFGAGITGSIAEVAVWKSALQDVQLARLAQGVAADQVAASMLTHYWPIRGRTIHVNPDYVNFTTAALRMDWTAGAQAAHPTIIQPDDLVSRQPAYALDLYHTDGTQCVATRDLYADVDYDVLGATYAGRIKNTHTITVTDQLSDAFYGVQQPAKATVIIGNVDVMSGNALVDATWATAIATTNPWVWYRLNESSGTAVTDSSGNSRSGTYQNTPTLQVDGAIQDNDKAITLTAASSQAVRCDTIFNQATPTMSLWVKLASLPGADMDIAGCIDGVGWDKTIYVDSTGHVGGYAYDGGQKTVTSTGTLSTGAWHWVVMTADGVNLKLYIDGQPDGSTACGNTFATYTSANLYAGYGRHTGGGATYANASIDEFACWSTALSAGTIATLYASASASTITFLCDPTDEWRGVRARLRRYERTSHALQTDLTGVVTDAQWGDAEVSLTIESHDTSLWSTMLPRRLITVDEFPSATDLGAPVPVVFGKAQVAAPACGRDDLGDPGGADHVVSHVVNASGMAQYIPVRSVWYDAEPSAPGLELATAWDEAPGDPTYASATTFTVTGTLDYRYATGMPVRTNCNAAGIWSYSWIVSYSSGTVTLKHAVLFNPIETGCVATINPTPTAAGTNYVAGDVLTISTGGTECTVVVRERAAGTGAVTLLELLTPGQDYTTGTGKATTGGSGADCTVEIVTVSDGVQLASEYIVEYGRYTTSGTDLLSIRFPGTDVTGGVVVDVENINMSHPVTVLGEVLRHTVWGLGQTIDTTAFSSASTPGICGISGAVGYALGGDRAQRRAVDILNELCMIAGCRIWYDADESKWRIEADGAPAAATMTLGYGPGTRNNIKRVLRYGRTPVNEQINRLSFRYGTKGRTVSTQDIPALEPATNFLYTIRAAVLGTAGAERVVTTPWVQHFATAKYVAAYLAKRLKYADRMLECVVGPEGARLNIGELVTVVAPVYGLNEDMRVRSVQKRLRDATVTLESYNAEIFTFDAGDITFEATATGLTEGDYASGVVRKPLPLAGSNLLPVPDFNGGLTTTTIGTNMVRGWTLVDWTGFTAVTVTTDLDGTISGSYLTITTGDITESTQGFRHAADYLGVPVAPGTYLFSIYADQPTGWKFQVWYSGLFDPSTVSTVVDANSLNPLGWKRYYCRVRLPANAAAMYWKILIPTESTTFKFEAPQVEVIASGTTRPTEWKRSVAWATDPASLLPGTFSMQRTDDPDNTTSVQFPSTTKSALSGATVTATGLIPAGSYCLGVTAYVSTLITGATSFDIGDGSTANLWGNDVAVALGTRTDDTDFAATWAPKYYSTAQNVVLTANGSNFTAGAVVLTAHVIRLTGPAA